MICWTPKMVEERLAKAVAALEQAALHPQCRPSPDGALCWFLWLEQEDAELLWMRVECRPWKQICRHFNFSRATANRRVEYLLTVLARNLNDQRVPEKWPHRYVVECAQIVSSDK
jgi:uncharacterized protein DUF6362